MEATAQGEMARPRSRLRRWAMNGLALLIIYGNLAVIFQPVKLGMEGATGLPLPLAMQDAFLMTGMFSGLPLENSLYVIEGRTSGGGDPGRWIALRVKDHFPQRMGVTYTQLFALRFWDMFGERSQERAWAMTARKIRLRHNRLHPEQSIDRVRFGVTRWPISREGYWALKQPGRVRHQLWYTEASPAP